MQKATLFGFFALCQKQQTTCQPKTEQGGEGYLGCSSPK